MIRGRMIQTLPPVSASEVMPVPCWNGIESGFPGAFDEHHGPALRDLIRFVVGGKRCKERPVASPPSPQFSITNSQCSILNAQ